MAEADVDWQLLAKRGGDIHERLAAAARVLRTDDPRVDVLCTTFVDVSVATGNIRRAFDDAIAAALAGKAVPARPDNGGAKAGGVAAQNWAPYEVRQFNEPVFEALARRAHERPALARWLFEATKLYPAERMQALAALDEARADDAFADGIASIVTLAAAQSDPGGDLLRDLAAAWVTRPAWLVALLEAVADAPRAAQHLADALYAAELPGPAIDEALRPRVVELAKTAPSGARALAIATLRLFASTDELDSILVAALADEDAHERVVEAAARLAAARGIVTAAVIDAAALAAERDDDIEALDALLASGRAALSGEPTTRASTTSSVVEGSFQLGEPFVVGELTATSVHRVRMEVPSSDWATDDDEVGVAVVGRDVAAYHVAPVRLASRRTGAAGARRHVAIVGVHRGRLVLSITSPFSDRRGWGNDNYVLGCDPRDGTWVAYRVEGEALVLDRALDRALDAPIEETALPQASFGEAIVWSDEAGLHFVPDGTPYHLDDWQTNPIVSHALDARAAARARREAALLDADAEPALHDELAAAWPRYDVAEQQALRVLGVPGGRVARVAMPERQALIWLAR